MAHKTLNASYWIIRNHERIDFASQTEMEEYVKDNNLTFVPDDSHEVIDPITAPPTSMSDAAIETVTEAQKESDDTLKPFRYRPTETTSQLLARSTEKTGLTSQEIVTIALMLLQDASQVEVHRAVSSILQDRAQALFDSLK